MATTVLLIRHGETDAVGHLIAGRAPGWPLNATGEAQVTALARQLASVPLTAVVSSPLERTVQTAAAIASIHRLPVERDAAFLEFNFGRWEGLAFDVLHADPDWQQFNRVRSIIAAPGGESMLDVQQRAVRGLKRLCDRFPDGVVALVSHGDVIRALVLHVLGVPLDFMHRLEVAPARLSVVQFIADVPTVRQVNGDSVPPLA